MSSTKRSGLSSRGDRKENQDKQTTNISRHNTSERTGDILEGVRSNRASQDLPRQAQPLGEPKHRDRDSLIKRDTHTNLPSDFSRGDRKETHDEQVKNISRRNTSEQTSGNAEGDRSNRTSQDLSRKTPLLEERKHQDRDSLKREARANLPSDDSIIRVILLGKTGHGKSSLGNLLLSRSDEAEQFTADNSAQSVTRKCAVGRLASDRQSLVVVDTPGFIDTKCKTDKEKTQLSREITKCIQKTLPGPHAFLIVMKLGRFTEEDNRAVQQIKDIFGPDLLKYCIVIFTEKDSLDRSKKTIKQWVTGADKDLIDFLDSCGQRYTAINNVEVDPLKRQQMRQEVVQMIMDVMKTNENVLFTSEFLEKINKVIKINKDGMGRSRVPNVQFGHLSIATSNINGSVIEIVEDDELIEEAQAIVQEKVLSVLQNR